jgi:hypothetical protein
VTAATVPTGPIRLTPIELSFFIVKWAFGNWCQNDNATYFFGDSNNIAKLGCHLYFGVSAWTCVTWPLVPAKWQASERLSFWKPSLLVAKMATLLEMCLYCYSGKTLPIMGLATHLATLLELALRTRWQPISSRANGALLFGSNDTNKYCSGPSLTKRNFNLHPDWIMGLYLFFIYDYNWMHKLPRTSSSLH